ncbi:MAG: hypothetical protein V3S01_06975 [Dehalococcoidia bacterium]
MAEVKRPGDEPEASPTDAPAPAVATTVEPIGFHTIKGGVRFPVVKRVWSRKNQCVQDTYEKVRIVRSRDPNTGDIVNVPGVKTYITTYCLDMDVQRAAAEKRGIRIRLDLDEHAKRLGLNKKNEPTYSDEEAV